MEGTAQPRPGSGSVGGACRQPAVIPRRRLARGLPRTVSRTGAVLLAAGFLGFTTLPQAATPPGTQITNVATGSHLVAAPPVPGGATPALQQVEIASNAVVTQVAALSCFSSVLLEVLPPGTVAPGEPVDFTVSVNNDAGVPLTDVVISLPLDPGLADPSGFSDGAVPGRSGGSVPLTGSYDSSSRTVSWAIPLLDPGQGVSVVAETAVLPGVAADSVITETATAGASQCVNDSTSNTVTLAVVPPVLTIVKRADRSTAAPGDGVVYELEITHAGTEPDLASVELVDVLPAEMRYVPGSARVDGAAAPDPAIGTDGRTLRLPLGALTPGMARNVRLAALVGPVPRRTEAVNRARAEAVTAGGAGLTSPTATASVTIVPGPFRQEAILAGRVFLDDDGDGLPGPEEPGVPGVLVMLQDGRGAITDITGRWHLEGVRPGLHVLRADPSTLPHGLQPAGPGGPLWGGTGRSRFVEARASTLVVADLPVGPGGAPRCRIQAGEAGAIVPAASLVAPDGSPAAAAPGHLERAASLLADRGQAAAEPQVACDSSVPSPVALQLQQQLINLLRPHRPGEGHGQVPGPGETQVEDPLEEWLRTAPAAAAILSPPDGRVSRASISVEVILPAGASPLLEVNGVPVPAARIGTTSILPSRGIQAARYTGVPLSPGANRLAFRARAPEGGEPATPPVERILFLPGPTVELRLSVAGDRWVADGVTAGQLRVEAVDGSGVRSTDRAMITLEAEGARPLTPDADPTRPGTQVRLRDGEALVRFAPLTTPARVRVLATTDTLEAEREIDVVPGGGPWRFMGLVEGRMAGDGGVEGDGGAPPGLVDPISGDGGRVAFHARGPVGESSRLTIAVDTERERDRDRLFQRFEPDEFFPVTGDASVPAEETPHQGKLFARLDGPLGFGQIGDFETGLERTELARYDRRMSGLSGRVTPGPIQLQGFAASTDQEVARDVFAADGTSGPFLLSQPPVVARSETVIVEVRDRFRPEKVLSRQVKRRDLDYDLDPEAGTILFRGPVAAFDADLNPVRVVVLYESRGGGADHVTAGGRLALRPGDRFEAGTTLIHEERAGDDLALYGVDLSWRPRPGMLLRGEVAATDQGDGSDTAVSLSLSSRSGPELEWDFSYRDLPAGFANPTLLGSPELGSRRAGGSVLWRPSDAWRVKGEGFVQEDDALDLTRQVAGVQAERRFADLAVLGGLRQVNSESGTLGDVSSTLVEAGVRGRLAGSWTGELLHQQVLGGDTAPGYPTRTAAGLAYEITAGTRLFLRQELESGDGPDRDRTVLGLESQAGPRTKALARYALEEGASGAALRASAGVETTLPLTDLSTMRFSAARLDTTKGDDQADFTSMGAAYEYRAGASLLASRYEIFLGTAETRHLLTASGAFRAAEPWTFFLRERLFITDPDGGGSALRLEGLLSAAYRPLAGRWQFLARVDQSLGSGQPGAPGGLVAGGLLSEPGASVTGSAPTASPPAGLGTQAGRGAGVVERDAWALSLAAGARLTARQRLASTVTFRTVEADAEAGLPATLTHLLSLHYTAEVHRRWTVGGSLRRFHQRQTEQTAHGSGLEVGYLAAKNLWVVGGYNVTGFSASGFPGADRTDAGPFVSLRFKFDEEILSWLR